MRRVLFLLVLAIAVMPTAAHADGTVDKQAWAQTGPLPTFVPADGRIYVAADVGSESARTFVHVDQAAIGPGAVLTVVEDTAASTLAAQAALVACPMTSALTASGRRRHLVRPPGPIPRPVARLAGLRRGPRARALTGSHVPSVVRHVENGAEGSGPGSVVSTSSARPRAGRADIGIDAS